MTHFYICKFYRDVDDAPTGIPPEWIAEQNLWMGDEVQPPYIIMSEGEIAWHKDDLMPAYQAYENGMITLESKLEAKIDFYGELGASLARTGRNKIGARNLIMNKTEAQIIAVVVAFSPIKAALEGGALKTARSALTQLKAAQPDYSDIMDYIINEITKAVGV